MCGRFALRANRNTIRHQPNYNLDVDEWQDEDGFVPRYNIAPRSNAPVVRRRDPGPSGSSSNDALMVQTMRWGLVPHYAKAEDKSLNTTNARSENLVEGGGMWQTIKGKRRCAIPCQGYYEWLHRGKTKLPHFTKRKDGALLFMAGLYDCVIIDDKPLWTFTIVTTDAPRAFAWLHDRQPVFLMTRAAIDKWLDTSSQAWSAELSEMVKPCPDPAALECYQVPKEVGKIGTESPTYIEPVAERKDGIQAMFANQRQHQLPQVTPGRSHLKHSSISPSSKRQQKRQGARGESPVAGTSSSQVTDLKRSHSRSPSVVLVEDGTNSSDTPEGPAKKRRKVKETDDSDEKPTSGVGSASLFSPQKIDGVTSSVSPKKRPPKAAGKAKSNNSKGTTHVGMPGSSPKKARKTGGSEAKITSFFNSKGNLGK